MVVICSSCGSNPAQLRRSHLPAEKAAICRTCFIGAFELEIHGFIIKERLFHPGDVIAVGVSGGKDSAVLLHILWELNRRYDYGIQLIMVAVDEGIVGYRDHSLHAVAEQQRKYGLPLRVLSYNDLYRGWTMDRVVGAIGKRGNCTYCGVFRRQALERGSAICSATKLATGHNADDVAETVLMNLLRGDIGRLQRCVKPLGKGGPDENVPRVKPLFESYEKEIVMYARFLGLTYFATECLYAPNAYRGHARTLIKQFERLRPRAILDIIISGKQMAKLAASQTGGNHNASKSTCGRCGAISSRSLCHACALLEQLDKCHPQHDRMLLNSTDQVEEDDTKETVTAIEDLASNFKNTSLKRACACAGNN